MPSWSPIFQRRAGAVTWATIEWCVRRKPSILGTASGAVAGLVCITPASGFVQPMPALILGVAAGAICYLACTTLKQKFGYDDSLDAFGVHGIGGTLGALLTGVFATLSVNSGGANGLWYDAESGMKLMLGQVAAIVVTWVWAAVATFVILMILNVTMGLRVTQEAEVGGLDLSEHGEEGYILN